MGENLKARQTRENMQSAPREGKLVSREMWNRCYVKQASKRENMQLVPRAGKRFTTGFGLALNWLKT